MSTLPNGWRTVTPHQIAGEDKTRLVIGPFGSNLKTSDYRSSGVPLVFVRDIRARDFENVRAFVDPEKAQELAAHLVRPGDVLITKMGEPPGDSTVYSGTEPAVITADCIRLRPIDDFDAKFVAYAIQAPPLKQQIERITSGVAQRKVSLARFRSGLTIPIPHLHEQRRIVEILEEHLSHLDAADAGLSNALARLDALRASLLSSARQGAMTPLREVSTIQGGIQKQPRRAPRENSYPFLRVANVTAKGLDLTDVHRIELFGDELTKLRLARGDLLVVEGNGSASQIGRAALWDGSIEDCVHQNHLIRVRVTGDLLPEYLEAVWNSPETRAELTAVASSSSGLHTLSVTKLKRISIPIPERAEQQSIVATLADDRAARKRLVNEVQVARTKLSGLRRAVLAGAFSGTLTGRHTDDEVIEGMATAHG
ncbi:hypothetical protein GCM10011492_15640 [Flexivirga endophytica]|uniref:Type I restriction modification DNA specificity domain-containing protein n=1 Tax=Flexivirga endophytica TaxID=1849103 RepID=A0A916WSU1_9MICO|nr:restriction endonuclease subunit S [Flexivirga endophytica]GGB26302.1 hypothetical protein GCM10011492_15640 [Flexivirga endophytica]GHB54821.1 hypothetical protein GCM10008112_24960 [Flexivirga endophytica]